MRKGRGGRDACLTVNAAAAAQGRVGVVVDGAAPFEDCGVELLRMVFMAAPGAADAAATVDFADGPPARLSICAADAGRREAVWTAGAVRIVQRGR